MNNKNVNKEQAILLAAEQEFMEKGFAGAKTVNIAKRAGVTHAMLHYYYRTKQNLFEKVLNEKVQLVVASVIIAFTGSKGDSLIDRIVNGAIAHFEFIAQNPLLPQFITNEAIKNEGIKKLVSTKIKEHAGVIIGHIQREIDQHVEAGIFRPVDAVDLLLDTVSLNVFPFLFIPIIDIVAPSILNKSVGEVIEMRKNEIKKMLRLRLLVNYTE